MSRKLSNDYLLLFCEKNSDGTKNLRLKGNELQRRIGQRVRDADIFDVAIFLQNNSNVVNVNLSYNRITNTGFETLVINVLSVENNIAHLCLVGCDIGPGGIEKLCTAWKTLKLITLRLTGNKLGPSCGKCLGDLVWKLRSLEVFDIGETDQTLSSLAYIFQSISGNDTLKVLDISSVVSSSSYYKLNTSYLADRVGKAMSNNYGIIELHLQKCHLDCQDIDLMLSGLRCNNTLHFLDIAYNNIGSGGIILIAKLIAQNSKLIGLNVAGNGIDKIGALCLSELLPYSNIRLLDISENKIDDESLAIILKTSRKAVALRVLYLWGNNIGPTTKVHLKKLLDLGCFKQIHIDFQLYYTDEGLQVAKYPGCTYKSKYYCQLEHNEVQELRIKRNNVPSKYCNETAYVNFLHYDKVNRITQCIKDNKFVTENLTEKQRNLCLEKEKYNQDI